MNDADKPTTSILDQDRKTLHDAIHEHNSSKENLRREKNGLPFTPFTPPVTDEERINMQKKKYNFLINYLGNLNTEEKLIYEKDTGNNLVEKIKQLKQMLKDLNGGKNGRQDNN